MKINKMDKEYKSNSKIYLKTWLVLITIYLLGNLFKIYLLKDIPWDIFFIGIFIFLGKFGSLKDAKLQNYLKKNHYEIWKKEYYNGEKREESFDDPFVSKLESELRTIGLLCLMHFFSAVISFGGLNILKNATGFNAPLKYILM